MSTWPPSDGRDDEGMPPAEGGPLGSAPPPAGSPPAGFPPAGFPPPGSYPPPAAPPPGSYPQPGYGTPPYPPGAAGPGGYGQPAYVAPADHPAGTQVLVLGLLAFVFCQILGPVAWIQGNKAISEIDAAPWAYGNRSTVQIGRILGIISTVILALFLLGGLLFVLLVAVAGTSSST